MNEKGFTLIEMMLTMLLLVLAILGSMSLQVAAINGNGKAMAQTNGNYFSSGVAEHFMALPWDDKMLDGNVGGANHPIDDGSAQATIEQRFAQHRNFNAKWVVTDIMGDAVDRPGETISKKIAIECSWLYRGKVHYNTLTVIKAGV